MSISGNAGKALDTSEGLHEFVCEVARRAGELQLSRYQNPGEIREKAPKDIVTEVDLLCEELMVGAIGAGSAARKSPSAVRGSSQSSPSIGTPPSATRTSRSP